MLTKEEWDKIPDIFVTSKTQISFDSEQATGIRVRKTYLVAILGLDTFHKLCDEIYEKGAAILEDFGLELRLVKK